MAKQAVAQSVATVPSITVVVPLYNKADTVEASLRSILAQTSAADQIIVIDDASRDDGLEKVRGLDVPNLKILERSEPGPGGYAARNLGIQVAETEWIAFLDADDSWEPDHLAQLRAAIAFGGPDCGGAFTAFNHVYGDGRIVPSRSLGGPDLQRFSFEAFLQAWLRIRRCPIQTSASAFRKDVLLQAGLFPAGKATRGGDKDLWLRAVAVAPAAYSSRPTANYLRDAPNMVTRTAAASSTPIIVRTIAAMIERQGDPSVVRLLKATSNLEILGYAVQASRAGRVDPAIYENFDWASAGLAGWGLKILIRRPTGLWRKIGRLLIGGAVQ